MRSASLTVPLRRSGASTGVVQASGGSPVSLAAIGQISTVPGA
jgi:hypothetical protein